VGLEGINFGGNSKMKISPLRDVESMYRKGVIVKKIPMNNNI
jgi:hypothetical protein